MTFRNCQFSNHFTPSPTPMPTLPASFHHYYLNKNVTTAGSGTQEDPFRTFSEYRTFAQGANLSQQVVIEIDDADLQEDFIIESISALSENLFIYAPFASVNNIRFNYTGSPSTIFLEKSQVVVGHIYGNIVMSKESFLTCTGECGTGQNGSMSGGTVSTAITFDNRESLDEMYLNLNVFRGTIDFSGIGDNLGTLHMNINDWDEAALRTALGTLPDASAGATGGLRLTGSVEGQLFPREYPIFKYVEGFPTNIPVMANLATGVYTLVFECTDIFNLKGINFVTLSRSVGVDDMLTSSNAMATSHSFSNNRVSVNITITPEIVRDLSGSAFNGEELQIALNYRLHYYEGQTNHDIQNSNIHFVPVGT